MQQHHKNSSVHVRDTSALATEIYIDDDWLEAVLENLALAQLSKAQCMMLIDRLEAIERKPAATDQAPASTSEFGRTLLSAYRPATARIVVGGRFAAEFNEYGMRSPASMSCRNVCDSIEHAVRRFQSLGQSAAVRQIVFFISSNMEEVIADADDE